MRHHLPDLLALLAPLTPPPHQRGTTMKRSKILIAAWDGAGCVPPLMSVARALVGRGHDVRVIGDPVLAGATTAAGARHVPWTRAPHRRDRNRASWFIDDLGPDGFAGMRDNLAVGPAAAFAADVREEIWREPPDLVLAETLLLGALVAAEAAEVPAALLNTTINMFPVEGVPPFGPGFLPAVDDADRELHAAVAEQGAAAWNEALPALNRAREEQGLPPLAHVLEQYRSAARVLVLTSSAFDFTGPLPPFLRYVGPRLDDLDAVPDGWTPQPGDEPLVLVSLSTEFQDQTDTLARVAAALGTLPVRGVVTTGRAVDPGSVPAPANVQVLRLAPHREVLPHASVVVTHCGHGTTIKALAAGIPLVCLPMGRDQNDVAARVVHRGAGVRLDPASAPEQIAAAVREVLDDPAYRVRASSIADVIAVETADDLAVREIEELLGSHHGAPEAARA
ncbi:nucleotide disphospho-sugar-binding domain-containing protein [Nocardioides sp. GCM10027113]|uniref:nucleotide disphospho-sugar-binding domain-containing protein n=1 Tax=unclassified Nocardioides TaxID=2615069 RepID=UPI00360993B6